MTSDGSPRPISPLRARMIEDMTVRGFSEKTRHDYVRQVRAFGRVRPAWIRFPVRGLIGTS